MLEINNLYAGYGKNVILQDVSVAIPDGKITGIIGPNGCGKSTLLKSVIGLADIHSGELLVDGKAIHSFAPAERAREIAYLPQSKNVPDMTVEQMVLHGRFAYLDYPRRYGKKDVEIARRAMEKMELEAVCHVNLSRLSGGQRQKAYIAMAIAQEAPVILMDEPTTYLDIAHQLRLCDIMRELAAMGKSVVAVLHDLPLAFSLCHSLYVMHKGSIAARGTPEEILAGDAVERVFDIEMKKINSGEKTHYVYSRSS
ncbi:MAG: ABC transporter ATP-binding protein [Clostridia bacterium]|nr:ABC transporter ATP-binding protein [Clostridia bacterium]